MESLFKLGILLRITDMVSGPVAKISGTIDTLHAKAMKLQPVFDKFRDYGQWIAGAGIAGALGLGIAVTSFANLEEAQLGLRTLLMDSTGQVGAEYSRLNSLAEDLGTSLPGSTRDMIGMFTALREQGVQTNVILGGMGEAAAKFAVLMKVSFAEGATHVAKFSEALGIADKEAVPFMDTLQRLKGAAGVNVADLSESLKYAGSSLKALRIQGLEAGRDVSAAIGLMATSSIEGSQAGTNFAQALTRMAEISSKLDSGRIAKMVGPILDAKGIKLNFFDEAGNFVGIRNMMGELEKLRAINPQEQLIVLSKLFGAEASRPLSVFINQGVAGFDAMLEKMRNQADMQTKINEIMSGTKMQWETLTGTLGNVVAHIGAVVTKSAGLNAVMRVANDLAGRMDSWIIAHPRTAGIIGGLAVAVTGAALAIGGLLLVIGLGGTLATKMMVGYGLLVQGVMLLKLALGALIPVVWSFTAALLANPMTWIVLAIVAGVAVVGGAIVWMYRRVEWFKTMMDGFLFFLGFSIGLIAKGWKNLAGWVSLPFSAIWSVIARLIAALPKISSAFSNAMAGMLNALPAILGGLFRSGQKIVSTMVDGIRSMAGAVPGAIKDIFGKVRNLLPFSDAKEGPLSQLTLSGSRIMSTLGDGITGAAPGLHKTMATALAGAALTTSIAVAPPPSFAADAVGKAAVSAGKSAGADSGGKKLVIHIEKLELPGVSNAANFVAQLQALVEAYDGE
uniref:Phage tail tape measure protein, TP901 family n=1 Tax=Geobacter sp. (strain M21) TaxID=443144 RepID=C6E6Q1_GEOSM